MCTGAFLLAEAGILDGRRATTHWSVCDLLARLYPGVDVDPEPIFVRDGNVWTSAGVTAGMDLALALVEDDLGRTSRSPSPASSCCSCSGRAVRRSSARNSSRRSPQRDTLRELQRWIAEHPEDDQSVAALAARAR